ncbi:hypothetical protein [Deinococcus aerius]|uniref:hypothetical protein n=1 Tax=Deinococcus aerius TaxID=200253 RepID=UPI001056FD84|nr:hypothetical protein [Deinococcus aerius]
MQQLGKFPKIDGPIGHILKLFGGSAVGQLVSIAFVPILTILYTPNEYTVYATYSAIIGVSAVFYSLRLEQILITAPNSKTFLLARSAKYLGTCSSVFVGIASYFYFNHLYGIKSGFLYAVLTGLGVYASGHLNVAYQLAMREENTQSMAITRIATPGVSSILQSLFSFLRSGAILVLGDVLGRLASLLIIRRASPRKEDRGPLRFVQVKAVVQENFDFVKFNLLTSLSSVISVQLPAFLLPLLYKDNAGSFLFALRLVSLPIPLISQSISLVLLKESSYRSEDEMAFNIKRVVKTLLIFLVPSMLWVAIYSNFISTALLPQQWKDIGLYLGYFAVWIILWVPSSSLSSVLIYKSRQRASFKFAVFELVTRALAILIPFFQSASLANLAIFVTLGNCLIAFCALYWFLSMQRISLYSICLEATPIILLSVVPILLYCVIINALRIPFNITICLLSLIAAMILIVRFKGWWI